MWVQVALCTGGSAGGCVLTPVRKTLGSGDKLSPGCPLLRQRQNCRPHCPELWAWVWALSNRGHHSSAPARPAGPSAAQDGLKREAAGSGAARAPPGLPAAPRDVFLSLRALHTGCPWVWGGWENLTQWGFPL